MVGIPIPSAKKICSAHFLSAFPPRLHAKKISIDNNNNNNYQTNKLKR